ncbi:ABC transporter substrate-binding protein [Candidatus Galacturonibacter soehngenii]|uniref:Sugar ABC transporter substrate-binding protein n=1 Tax=Candidatus Galacturonatibacter soehngenii TaxID=2307010 RepID=A0A7V7QHL6_9FIRM|nr:sugar ABC transporter substrate-binding protein [Candidatus Galacturonibacter soehngenii]KAB1434459.1 sugar ABC transporter substrate-binding protein [Candidatus Galacturonibacter soehngenii]MBA4686806.1 sugar ABC transporter substrate-binding protein [Candidatus Galacturonibacter soehngenii]
MRNKKFYALVLATTMVVASLAGCGSSKESTATTDTKESTTNESSETTDQASTSTDEEVTLTWALWDLEQTTYYQPLIDAYETANPNVKIKTLDLGSTDYMTVLATQLTGGDSTIDVATIKDIPGYATLVNKNQLEPLNDFITQNGIDTKAYSGITDQITIDNNLYALPFRSDFWVVYYNKALFDAAGVDYPTNDMTFAQYDELARKVSNDKAGTEKVYGAHYHTWRSAVQLFGILDGKNTIVDGAYDFLKPYYEMVLNEQKDGICQDYAALKTASLHYSAAFYQNQVAMMNMGTWFIPTLIKAIESGESQATEWGIVKYPHADGVEPGSTLATITSLAVSKASENKEAALDFVKFVTGEEGAAIIANTGTFPAIMTDQVINTISSIEGYPADDTSKVALHTANTYLEMPVHEKSSEIETILNDAHDNIMTGNITIEDGIKEMNEQVSAVLGK